MVAAAVVAVGVGTVATGAMEASAAGSAASKQQQAANNATQANLQMFNETQQNLQPYVNAGNSANDQLSSLLGTNAGGNPLTSYFGPVTPNLATVAQTPGYQFNLYQGLKATQNNAASRGLGVSGAALKGAANYATGLADSTYQNQFNNLVTNQNNVYNRLLGQAQLGENAAAGLGTAATQTGNSIASNDIGAGNAAAAGTIGAANALSGAVNNAAANVQNLYLFNALSKSSGGKGIFG